MAAPVVAHHAPMPAVTNGSRQPACVPRDIYNQSSLGPTLFSQVKQSRVLMVGAGGIGCELLKNLVLSGFGSVEIVDLDTIDLSNLNRQFLFRHEHIKKSKALVAREAALKFNPRVAITAHHANIKEPQFNLAWFRRFSLVFNALDNLDARRHVNRMCLAADVPLIESGTTGFNGQVQVIKKGVTACYDCAPKELPKSFPVCTIRSTPSQPIHCIVWGKSYLLNEIFGASEDQPALDNSVDGDNANEIEELKKESESLKLIRASMGTEEFPKMLFDKVYKNDIERLRSMDDMWKSRRRPDALDYETLNKVAEEKQVPASTILQDDQRIWSLEENLAVFKDSLARLSERMKELKAESNAPIITFDKDDDDTLDFVAASANIRSSIFGIESKSRFDIKQMAGNIIPAIATTNAIVAGLCLLEAFKVFKGDYSQAKEIFLTPFGSARLLAPDRPREPNPDCPVCSVFQTSATVDLSRATLEDFVENFVRGDLEYGDKEFAVSLGDRMLYDPDETENLGKKLADLGIGPDSFLTVTDEDDDPLVNVSVNIQEPTEPMSDKTIMGQPDQTISIPKRPGKADPVPVPVPVPACATNGSSHTNGKHAREDVTETQGTKRAREDGGDDDLSAKKLKATAAAMQNDDIVLVEDDVGGGAIVIDDD